MRVFWKLSVASLCLCLCGCHSTKTPQGSPVARENDTQELSSAVRTPPDHRKVHVVIVAVPHFAISKYNSSDLAEAFITRCDNIGKYFTKTLGEENVQIHPYCTEETTKRETLRRLFSLTIPSFSADTVTLVFIMSHGEAASFRNDYLSNDLELITSDTYTSDEEHDAKGERQFSSILFASELMSWLERAPSRSTILIFLDTCHAGAAASLGTSLRATLQSQFGLRFLVLGSSLSQDQSYSALFTKELLDLWQQNHCLDQGALPHQIYDKMKTEAALKESEGLPRYVVEYNGPLCLGNFGKDRHLLFMYGGQGAQDRPYQYTIYDDSGKQIKADQMDFAFLPVPLDANKYVVAVKRGEQFVGKWPVDLTRTEHQTVWLDALPQSEIVGTVGEAMIEAAKKNGSSASEIRDLVNSTAVAYYSVGRKQDALRVIGTVSYEANPHASVIESPNPMLPTFFQGEIDQSAGHFRSAEKYFVDAAHNESNPELQHLLATKAYTSALAAGDATKASEVRRDFHLGRFTDILKVGTVNEARLPPESLKAAGIAALLDSKGTFAPPIGGPATGMSEANLPRKPTLGLPEDCTRNEKGEINCKM